MARGISVRQAIQTEISFGWTRIKLSTNIFSSRGYNLGGLLSFHLIQPGGQSFHLRMHLMDWHNIQGSEDDAS